MTEYSNAPEWFRPYAEAQAQLLAELGLRKEQPKEPKEDKTDSDEATRAAKAWAKKLPDNDRNF